jgi:hypothetical protein
VALDVIEDLLEKVQLKGGFPFKPVGAYTLGEWGSGPSSIVSLVAQRLRPVRLLLIAAKRKRSKKSTRISSKSGSTTSEKSSRIGPESDLKRHTRRSDGERLGTV